MPAIALLLTAAAIPMSASADQALSPLFGRWTVTNTKDKFSTNGALYRIVDISPCGKDVCGVSVQDGKCGATLFRFAGAHSTDHEFKGRGKWGANDKQIWMGREYESNDLTIQLGKDNFDPFSRISLPTFFSTYARIGDAACKLPAPGA